MAGAAQAMGYFSAERMLHRDTEGVGSGDGPGRALIVVLRRTGKPTPEPLGRDCAPTVHEQLQAAFYDALEPPAPAICGTVGAAPAICGTVGVPAAGVMPELYRAVAGLKHAFRQRLVGTARPLADLAAEIGPALQQMQGAGSAHGWWTRCMAAAGQSAPLDPASAGPLPMMTGRVDQSEVRPRSHIEVCEPRSVCSVSMLVRARVCT